MIFIPFAIFVNQSAICCEKNNIPITLKGGNLQCFGILIAKIGTFD
ncbi:hypothetical protein FM107_15530 [Sphingobacterium sp. JB170]|nr:hypothetical protein FM107_15530 [Sphingobacterium sp. JB170]